MSRFNQKKEGEGNSLFSQSPLLIDPVPSPRSSLLSRLWPLALLALCAEMAYAILNTAAIPYHLHDTLHAPPSWIGIVISTFLITETLFKAFLGYLGDRKGRKLLLTLGPLLSACTPLIMRWTTSVYFFLPLRALDGIGAAALWPNVFATVSTVTTSGERVTAMSVFNMMYLIGLVAGLPLYSLVRRITDTSADVFFLISGLFLLSGLIAYFFIPETRTSQSPRIIDSLEVERSAVTEAPHWKATLVSASQDPFLRIVMLIVFIETIGINLLYGPLSLYIKDQLHLPEETVGSVFLLPGLVVVLLAVPLGKLGGRLGKVRSVLIGLGGASLCMWFLPLMKTPLTFSLTSAPMVIGFLIALPAWLALISEMAPMEHQGTVMGAIWTANGLGAILGPTLGGFLYQGHPTWPFYGAAFSLTLSFLLFLKYFREGKRVQIWS